MTPDIESPSAKTNIFEKLWVSVQSFSATHSAAIENLAKFFFYSFLILAYIRIFFGMDFSDEAAYITFSFTSSIGGKPFVNNLMIQQTASLLYEPIARLYYLCFGTTGAILFFRHLCFALALVCFKYYRKIAQFYIPTSLANLVCLPLIIFVPYNIRNLSYNTMGSYFFGLFLALAYLGVKQSRLSYYVGASFSCAIAMISYPNFAVPLFVHGILFLIYFKAQRKSIFLTAGLTIATLGIFALTLLYRVTIDQLLQAVNYSKVAATKESEPSLVRIFIFQIIASSPNWLFFIIPAIEAKALNKKYPSIWILLWPLFAILYLAFANIDRAPPTHVFLFVSFLISLLFITNLFSAQDTDDRLLRVSILTTVVGAITMILASSNRFLAAVLSSIYGGTFILISNLAKLPSLLSLVTCLILNSSFLFWNYSYVYRDDAVSNLTALIPSGPFAGIFTGPKRNVFISEISKDISDLSASNKSILIYDCFPGGYLMSSMVPKTISTTTLFGLDNPLEHRQLFLKYFESKENLPDIMIRMLSMPTETGDRTLLPAPDLPYKDPFFDYLPSSGNYELSISRPNYEVWKRKP